MRLVEPATATEATRPRPSVSIVMPCLDEERAVGASVRQALTWMAQTGTQGEVIVVDNGSTDASADRARAAGARVVQEPRRGYGAALRRGFKEARGSWIVMGDCDGSYDFSHLDALLKPLADGFDLSVGNRFAGSIASRAMTWSHRYLGTPAISALLKVFTGLNVGDSQCGLRAFTRDCVDRLDLRTDGMELASEMLLKASRARVRIAEVPIAYAERVGDAKLNTMRDGWRHLRFLLLASPNYLFTIPGIAFTLAGLVTLGIAVPAQPLEPWGLRWQPVFAGGIFLAVGINALLLGFAARLFTTARGMTNEDALLRFYHRHLGLEALIAIAAVLMVSGLILDVLVATVSLPGINQVALQGVAQSAIIIGTNIALVGALASLLEDSSATVRDAEQRAEIMPRSMPEADEREAA